MTSAADSMQLPPLPADPDAGPRRTALAIVAVTLLFLVVAVVWMSLAMLDVSVNARGMVVPPSRLQEVTSLEGGVVEAMLVAPGERVRRGQLLARLDTAQVAANLGESRQYWLAAMAGRARVDALIGGADPVFDPAWRAEAPELIDKELQLWRDARREHASARAAAGDAVRQRSAELDETAARIVSIDEELRVVQEAYRLEERLLAEGAGARADYLAAKQRLLALQAQRDGLRESLPRLRAALSQAQAAASEVDARARAQWGAQRSEFETKAAALASQMTGQQDRVARREIAAPVDGTVNRILVPTRGGVAMPGRPILEIVPAESALEMTVRVKPADIGFIRAAQEANVRVLAYDASTFGSMKARVDRVGADAVVDDKGEAFFEVQLSAQPGQLQLHGQPLVISPGMPVEAGILTGERTVLQYLLKPVLRGLQSSLQER